MGRRKGLVAQMNEKVSPNALKKQKKIEQVRKPTQFSVYLKLEAINTLPNGVSLSAFGS
jgi:hypothetical protein